jgi:prepilin-type N-terminal cleavage/methylation domain-containing protein
MAEDLMRDRTDAKAGGTQAGFSMIEMLMTAFVLAIGLLGLCMLQAMSLRVSRGSRSLETAVQVAEGVMDQVEMEGRLTWLNTTDSNSSTSNTNANLPNLIYLSLAQNGTLTQTFNLWGDAPLSSSTDPAAKNPFFTAVTKHVADVGTNGGTGQVSDYSVTVTFSDTVAGSGAAVVRTVNLTRRIIHG